MKIITVLTIVLLFTYILPYQAFAGLAIPAPVPIDGGLSLLVAAGIGYGVKKIRDERRKNKESKDNN